MPRVAYINSEALLSAADTLPSNIGRASLVHSLISSYGLLESDPSHKDPATASEDCTPPTTARIVQSKPASERELLEFHDSQYVDEILGTSKGEDLSDSSDNSDDSSTSASSSTRNRPPAKKRRKLDGFGLSDDCPVFSGISEYVSEVAGASLQAARELRDGRADIAIAWTGGRHHGKRGEASGFCYVQDVVLSILELKSPPLWRKGSETPKPARISKVLYLDLDLHHGDSVESAFHSTASVLTLSVHLHSPFFFPSTGALSSTGPKSSPASFHALNLALHPGLSSPTLLHLYNTSLEPIIQTYNPDAIVIQCGCDGLAGDPCKEWNLGLEGMGEVVRRVLKEGKKTLLLGGGGYNNINAAKCWTYLTAIALGRSDITIDSSIPPDLEEYEQFKGAPTLDVSMGNMRDLNVKEKLAEVETAFADYAAHLRLKYESL